MTNEGWKAKDEPQPNSMPYPKWSVNMLTTGEQKKIMPMARAPTHAGEEREVIHHVKDAERVLNAEDRPVAPGGRENHQPAVTSFGWDERGSVAGLLHPDHRLGVTSRGEGRFAAGLQQPHGAVLLHDLVLLPAVCFSRSNTLLRLRIRSGVLRPGHSAGRLRLVV
ncbi:hypothetical protein EYF80_007803 [Liparis tanakae]|uniref:Uncharacterized protein n=1 Tax=Liparis tanakae TaxID=230148 RepID=A0A4Z2IVB4_9TELE|nr:hypothetical protein EYF80_007803 [Liparis tanakae]